MCTQYNWKGLSQAAIMFDIRKHGSETQLSISEVHFGAFLQFYEP